MLGSAALDGLARTGSNGPSRKRQNGAEGAGEGRPDRTAAPKRRPPREKRAMGSILTNNSAMVALQTLNGINKNLNQVQNQISTGKKVGTAKDNAAVWAISSVMQSDVKGFKGISESLSLGSSTVAVARQAAEGKIVAAQESNVDRTKLQTDIAALVGQVDSVVGAAQFNGLNLIDGSTASVDILASLDRSGGGVASSSITVTAQDLSTTAGAPAVDALAGSDGASTDGTVASTSIDNGATADIVFDTTNVAAGDRYVVDVNGRQASYTVTAEDLATSTPNEVVAAGVRSAVESLGIAGLTLDIAADTITVSNGTGGDIAMTSSIEDAGAGGLAALSGINVTTALGAQNALADIEGLIQTSIDAAAAFGSVQGRIEVQSDFVSKLSDSLKSGIGSLVDADLEEASARLQALQVQQQLGVQALSIANQAPQSVLSLFR